MIFQELDYFPEMTVEENFFVGNWPRNRLGKVNWKEIRIRASALLKNENLSYSPKTKLKDLTISDIQMLEIVKAVSYNSDIIIMDEPTRGIDVGAKQEIYKLMRSLVREKKALIMISSELPELIMMCDRIYVMAKGKITGMMKKEEFTQEKIMTYATGVRKQKELRI